MTELKVSHGLAGPTLSICGWRLTEATYAPGQHVSRHEHALSSWTLVISGCVEETFTSDSFIYRAGSVLTKPAVADHANRYGAETARCFLIELPHDEDSIGRIRDTLFSIPRLFSGGLVPDLSRRIYHEFHRRDRAAAFALECLLLELRLASGRESSPRRISSRQWLNDIRDHLEAEFRNPPSLGELGRMHNLHPAYICQQFRMEFGQRLGDFVRDIRFAWAREAVASGSSSLSDIAFAAGFSDQAHLSRDFQRRLGISPRCFRASSKRCETLSAR
jgi:AraC-like DNA-binding protein